MIFLNLLIISSIILGSDLVDWIALKADLIKKDSYELNFKYGLSKSKQKKHENSLETVLFYSINADSSIAKINNRLNFFYKDYMEIIDLSSKQKIIQSSDVELQNLKAKLVSIFTNKNFKILKISKNKYLLSLNDYYINMNVNYEKNKSYISELSFYQAPYWIYIKDLNIISLSSIPLNDSAWNNYKVFDFR
tara:strand:+ start:12036 stop:12611 length:576 start_codon:yes stop_codon:yes gene_type:complete